MSISASEGCNLMAEDEWIVVSQLSACPILAKTERSVDDYRLWVIAGPARRGPKD